MKIISSSYNKSAAPLLCALVLIATALTPLATATEAPFGSVPCDARACTCVLIYDNPNPNTDPDNLDCPDWMVELGATSVTSVINSDCEGPDGESQTRIFCAAVNEQLLLNEGIMGIFDTPYPNVTSCDVMQLQFQNGTDIFYYDFEAGNPPPTCWETPPYEVSQAPSESPSMAPTSYDPSGAVPPKGLYWSFVAAIVAGFFILCV